VCGTITSGNNQAGVIMRLQKWISVFSTGFILAYNPLYAKANEVTEQIQVPQCLAKHLSADYTVLAENDAFKIIDVPSAELDNIVLIADKVHCGRFVNMTNRMAGESLSANRRAAKDLLAQSPIPITDAAPYKIRHQTEVYAAIDEVDTNNIMHVLNSLISFSDRSALKETGVDAATMLKANFEEMARSYNRTDTTTYFVKTRPPYLQPSLVTVIGKDIPAEAIVIGAHMDTLDARENETMPGAGDDGSGSASIMEMARVLLSSPIPLKRPVYFIWYSAEERGLIGSQDVVEHFITNAIPVKAAIQFDMTGFRNDRDDPTMWVYRDYTDVRLSNFITKLIKVYLGVPVRTSVCGYGCSDHASWMAKGIPAAFPCETDFEKHNTKIHTSGDTIDRLTPEHMTNFTKLGLAFAIELALE